MAEDDEVPEYLKNWPPPTSEEIWRSIEERFDEFCDIISTVRLEAKEQAVRQRNGIETVDKGVYWDDPEVGVRVRSWLQIPFDPKRDEQQFIEIWDLAKRLAEVLRPKISDRIIDVRFLNEWGAFCRYAAVIEVEYLRERPNLQHLMGAARQSKEQHKRWYAHVFMGLRREGDRRVDTDRHVLDHLYCLIKKGDFPNPAFPRVWFEEFIGTNTHDLTRAFMERTFPLEEIKELAKLPADDLPSLEFLHRDP